MNKHNLTPLKMPFKKGETIETMFTLNVNTGFKLFDYPVNYLLFNDKSMYVGESTQIKVRINDHLSNPKRSQFNEMIVLFENQFHQSATFNIETNLINYLLADGKYVLQNRSQIKQKTSHNYYNKNLYDKEIFSEIWDYLRTEKIAHNSLENLRNTDVFKLSPFKELSEEQISLKQDIIDFIKENIENDEPSALFIEGEAGTGKSVLLSSLINLIQELSKDKNDKIYGYKNNYLLVNHGEMIKTYKKIAKNLPNLLAKNFEKPTVYINRMKKNDSKSDIVLVDEAHLLLSQSDNYNNYRGENHLVDIINSAKISIFVFDSNQVLKVKSYWSDKDLLPIKKNYNYKTLYLETQLRMQADSYIIDWIDSFVKKRIYPIPFDPNYDIRIYDDIHQMYDDIKEKNSKFGLSRMVSTFDYLHKKDGKDYYVEFDDFKLPWNRAVANDTWAEKVDSINEVGSIYTVQGFDLNYVGVILGPSVKYDKVKNELCIDSSLYKDTGAFAGSAQLQNGERIKEEIILNSINVLMKRGVRGLYIYAVDEGLRRYLNNL